MKQPYRKFERKKKKTNERGQNAITFKIEQSKQLNLLDFSWLNFV